MNKTAIIGIFAGAIVLIGGLIWYAQPAGDRNTKANTSPALNSVLAAEEPNYNFGTISMANGNVSHAFKVKNTGTETITVSKLYTSCMCTTAKLKITDFSNLSGQAQYGPFGMPGHGSASLIKASIAPDQEAEVEVVFDPNAHGPAGVGRIERVVVLENNAGAPVELEFSATVTP
ncbi:MAG: hypothetical protein UX31_C0001G0021 [Candidatus Nomurabacteria bacterium GW2011_GWA1_46_11]|uniref:DUF1573 domain-containing protein n=2 Tax=Parcubacteria group TaxID=1794811 RepID=A0A1F8EYX3_9BACT|nr:MAG: hypothetical protein UX31_C0001G0021 [Candidatus Nomurabacteria bacterium GW2011_GWA1_46_11]OGN06053.1 MAG: hypothetical protein A2669_00790 [Candidatus Yanofskybacteria bacterium RIFCSPHIGHO2_01_FULL_48_25b]